MRLEAIQVEVIPSRVLSYLVSASFRRFVAMAIVLALLSFSSMPTVYARIPAPTGVPLERLLENAEAFITKNPEDAEGYYIIGRIHQMAFLRGCEALPVTGGETRESTGKPAMPQDPFADVDAARYNEAILRASKKLGLEGVTIVRGTQVEQDFSRLVRAYEQEMKRTEWVPNTSLKWSDRLDHADKALKNFRDAMRRDPQGCLYPLGLANFAEDLDRTLSREKITKLPPTLVRLPAKEIRDLYRHAFTLAAPPDHDWQKLADRMLTGEPISVREMDYTIYPEAGKAFLRVAMRDGAVLSKEEQAFVRVVKSGLAKRTEFDRKNPGLISPVIFSFAPVPSMAYLIAREANVSFDLSGYGGDERWPWVQATTCFLVWDPQHTGRITSARQMFGTYTFGIPWQNGYRALAALDDNADGVLSGSELKGMAVWIDLNGDAVSQTDEVTTVEEAGLTSVMVREKAFDGIHPMHPYGITLRDGRQIPTWDWMVAPHRAK